MTSLLSRAAVAMEKLGWQVYVDDLPPEIKWIGSEVWHHLRMDKGDHYNAPGIIWLWDWILGQGYDVDWERNHGMHTVQVGKGDYREDDYFFVERTAPTRAEAVLGAFCKVAERVGDTTPHSLQGNIEANPNATPSGNRDTA